jgi:membrane protein YdbS with pleckstrin-like domain
MEKAIELRANKLMRFRLFTAPVWGLIAALIVTILMLMMQYPLSKLIVGGVFFTITLFQVAVALTHHATIRYELTDTHLIKTEGITSKIQRSTPLDKITNVDVRQGPLDSMLGIGDIWIFTPSTGSAEPEVRLIGIANPYQVKDLLMQAKSSISSPTSAGSKSGDITGNTAVLQEILKTLRNIEDLLRER